MDHFELDGFTYVGTLTWASGAGQAYRCERCRALTDDQDGHGASHTLEDARLLRVIRAAVAQWRESASVVVVPDVEP